MAPRTFTIQEQRFSDDVAARIEAPPRLSTSAVYKSKWVILSNGAGQMRPSVTQIADFLLHLFQDRKLQPSIIGGYRTAIADIVGNDKLNIFEILKKHLTFFKKIIKQIRFWKQTESFPNRKLCH